jgi:DNA-binding winged helix-turn-helix (wHTH) protein
MRVSFGDCVLDLERRQLARAGRDVHLTPKALDLLALLVAERPRAVAKAEIHDHLWPGTFVSESNLSTLVAELRSALGDAARSPRYLKTVQRFGYAFCGTAAEPPEPSGPQRRKALRFTLEWTDGEVALREGENLIGREEAAAAWIASASVSRRHARILISGSRATLEDLDSKNGTFLRGQRLESPATLADGDEIRVGVVDLRIRILDPEVSTKTLATQGPRTGKP